MMTWSSAISNRAPRAGVRPRPVRLLVLVRRCVYVRCMCICVCVVCERGPRGACVVRGLWALCTFARSTGGTAQRSAGTGEGSDPSTAACVRPVFPSPPHNTLIVKKSAQRNRARIPLAFTDVTRRATLFNAAQNLENLARAHNLARAATRPMARFIDHAR